MPHSPHYIRSAPAPWPWHAAVALSSGGTVEGRVVARDGDGRVTLSTPNGQVTGQPVNIDAPRGPNWLRKVFARG